MCGSHERQEAFGVGDDVFRETWQLHLIGKKKP
jgi:hypothetical protein